METATETRTTTALTVRAPEPPYETLDETDDEADTRNDAASEETSDSDTEGSDSDAEDAEIRLYTSAPTTVRWGSQGYASSSSELRRTSSPVATDETDAQAAKPMLCTPTLMQRAAAASVSSSESHPTCLICLESLPSGGPARAPPVLVSNIPVRLVCNCTVHAHPACLARWLQRTLACPICHGAAQFQPRPGQVVRSSTHAVYQRLLEREEARQVDYVWEIRRRQCVHFLQCGCALTFLGALGWAFAAYSALSSPPSD